MSLKKKAIGCWGHEQLSGCAVLQDNRFTDEDRDARRQFLRFGAASLPMVLTIRADARQAVISQLQCAATLQSRVRILVDDKGAAWVGSGNVDPSNNKSVKRFKKNADFAYPNGAVPVDFRPGPSEGYSLSRYRAGYEVNPDNHLSSNLNWNYKNNKEGLYVALSVYYYENQGATGAWPGISCIASIITYINNQ